jgi:hypothetical protein
MKFSSPPLLENPSASHLTLEVSHAKLRGFVVFYLNLHIVALPRFAHQRIVVVELGFQREVGGQLTGWEGGSGGGEGKVKKIE